MDHQFLRIMANIPMEEAVDQRLTFSNKILKLMSSSHRPLE